MDKFWMVLIDGTVKTQHRHSSRQEAIDGAERLLNLPEHKGSGRGAIILEAIYYGKPVTMPVDWIKLEDRENVSPPPKCPILKGENAS